MPARPHDADEPGRDRADEASPDGPEAPDAGSPATPRPGHDAGSEDQGPGTERPDVPPDDVDRRWAQIVTQLQGDPRAWAPDPDVEEAESHFEPPDPGPVLGGDPLLTMAWGAVIGVPVLLMVAVVAWRDIPMVVLQAAGVGFLAGLGVLLWRMPHRRDEEDDDPGAVV